jgi:hypothetical protein
MDRLGPSKVLPMSAALVGIGALLFGSGNTGAASVGSAVAGGGRSLRAGRGRLYRYEKLPGVSCRHIDWCNADVRYGRAGRRDNLLSAR